MNFLRFRNPVEHIPQMPQGDCFANVTSYARDNAPNAEIIHGTVMMASGQRSDHAWIEQGNKVIDPTAGIIVDKKTYYRDTKAEPEARYSVVKAQVNMLKCMHHGPWHK